MSAASPLERRLRLLACFQRRGSLTVSDVRRILGCDRQKARRDLDALMSAGVPLEVRGHGADRSFVLPVEHRREGLIVTQGDTIALHFGRQLLAFADGTDLTAWLDQLGRKLGAATPPKTAELETRLSQRFVFHSEPYRPYGAADDQLDEVISALLGDRLLTLEYEARGGLRHWDRVMPLALVIYRRALYLLARLPWSDLVLRLAVDRIRDAKRTKLPFPYPTDFDVRAELDRNFGIFDGGEAPERVRIRFAPHAADLVQARVWHPTAEVTLEEDGSAVLEMSAGGLELVRLVMEWGSTAEVLEPTWLRDRVCQELRAALARYA